jgi:hypothetical protein
MVADDLATILVEDLVGTLAPSGDIWVDFSPPAPDDVFVVTGTGGFLADYVMDRVSPTIENATAQILSRSDDRDTAASNAQAAYDALNSVVDRWVGDTRYLEVRAQQPPFRLGKDENERWLYVFNVQVKRAC